MIDRNMILKTTSMLLAGLLATGLLVLRSGAQSSAPAGTTAHSGRPSAAAGSPYRNQPVRMANRARAFYGLVWGVESLSVKAVESGEIIRFTYHVIDADKAKTLNDKQLEPVLIDPEKGVKLVVPSLEKVGLLRQMSTPVEGKSYWMAFSNSGRLVKRGDRVNVVIGHFHADNLVVE
ncbi:MAG: hypothetical protein DMG38_13385 [Acidobacteria bacterium]|nr:MAG: hypothetical protein DMG38_13385 [Acidobacteriota bacterium]